MGKLIETHPVNPEPRLIRQAVDALRAGGLVVYPTDSCYAFGFQMGNKGPIRDIQRIRQTSRNHNFTLMCRDLSEIALYAKVDNWCYRMLKAHTPGPYTFILPATRDVPRRLQHPKRKTIGIRIPDHPVAQAILEDLGEPIMSSTVKLPGDEVAQTDAHEIFALLKNDAAVLIDSGSCGIEPTTVIDLTGSYPAVVREGKGTIQDFV